MTPKCALIVSTIGLTILLTLDLVLLYFVPVPSWLRLFMYLLGVLTGIQGAWVIKSIRDYWNA